MQHLGEGRITRRRTAEVRAVDVEQWHFGFDIRLDVRGYVGRVRLLKLVGESVEIRPFVVETSGDAQPAGRSRFPRYPSTNMRSFGTTVESERDEVVRYRYRRAGQTQGQ